MLGCIHILVYFAGKGECGIPLFRVRRSHNIPCLLQQLCDKYVSAIQEDRTLEELSLWRDGICSAKSSCEERFGLAAFRWDSSADLITLNKERHHAFKQTLSFSERGVGTLLFA